MGGAYVPSGEQWTVRHGEMTATAVEVGGAIRVFRSGDRDVLEPFPLHAQSDGGHGVPLLPWANRLRGGRYAFDGAGEQRLPLTEPDRDNAIHGLTRWVSWTATELAADRVVLGVRIHPQTGWPYPLDCAVAYALGDAGLEVELSVTNLGEEPVPIAPGHHPYLSPGPGGVDTARLSLAARERYVVDHEHTVPAGREPVAGGPLDFSAPEGRLIGDAVIDDALTGLATDGVGIATARLEGRDGAVVELWAEPAFPVMMVFTGDTLAPHRRRTGLAVEPMAAPANALQSGDGLVVVGPGEQWRGRWGARLAAAPDRARAPMKRTLRRSM